MNDHTYLTQARLDLVHNEQIKLRANYLNGVAVSIFAVGGLTTLLSLWNHLREIPVFIVVFLPVALMSLSVIVHLTANELLRTLR